ncbi:armadillo repeat-containing protein 3 isoform X2 [Rhinatrema bivittatum]|uniref:armadillo repeat-containing protein 3 isoform X2 n=1 Tax=Rhinatrema bivittatum TaxID=194408 RepID=UPI00112891E0|nr:armadillo repeat-containing protein 3 isoform X2 [Rhinatrema bivittatum]
MVKKNKKDLEVPPKDVFDPLIIESKNAATVVLMLNSPEEDILAKACDAIYRFAEKGDENKVFLLGLGAVEPLTKLISHEDRLVRRNACVACGVMALHSDVRRLLRKLNIISSIIGLLEPEEDVIIHEFASLCLASMAIEYTSKIQIFEHGGIDPLIRLLNSPDPDVQKNCVECLNLLVQDFQSRAAVWELNGIPPLLELLKSEYPVIQLLALKTLCTLSNDVEARVKLRENQALERLLFILETKELNDLHVDALLVVMNCLEDVETLELLRQTGDLEKLFTFTEISSVPEIQKNAAKAIAKAAHNSENRKILHEKEVEKLLINLLQIENPGVKAAACQAIAAMSETIASKEAFKKSGILKIVQLLSSEDGEVKESATLALAKLTTDSPNNVSAVAEAEGIEPLIHLLSDERDGAVANSATVLINMATQETLRLNMQAHGIMPEIVGPLQSTNDLVLSKAALTVAAVACDASARTELRNAGGLSPLVNLLHSVNHEVRRNACWAIMVCANDEPTATELGSLGALDILQEINQSRSRRNYFSEAAMTKLLDSDLTLKYSLLGYLLSSNIIYDGFYDCGKNKPNAKHLSLKELWQQEVNHHRAVLLVNAKPPDLTFTTASVSTPVEEKHESSSRRSPSSPSKGSAREKSPSKVKGKLKKEEEKLKEEDEHSKMQMDSFAERGEWLPPFDSILHEYIVIATTTILPLHNIKDQVVSLAQFVAEEMGGPVKKDKLHEFSWELHISELKLELQSNVIPIGKIKKGIFYHRALLFKALADKIGVACSLVRGNYNRAWNIVKLVDDSPKGVTGLLLPPKPYIVDLMYKPGQLMELKSVEADHYQHI